MEFSGLFTCEPGRTIARDARPLIYLNLVRELGTGAYALAPYQADSIARQLAAAMRAGLIRIPQTVAEADTLDRGIA